MKEPCVDYFKVFSFREKYFIFAEQTIKCN